MDKVFNYCGSKQEDKLAMVKKVIHAMRVSEHEEESELYLKGFTFALFGYESKLEKEKFLEKVCDKECVWIFSGKQTRIKMNHFLQDGAMDKLDIDE